MKKIYFTLLFILVQLFTFAQSNIQFPHPNASWDVEITSYGIGTTLPFDEHQVVRFYVDGDTIIDQQSYSKIYQITGYKYLTVNSPFDVVLRNSISNPTYYAAIRTDSSNNIIALIHDFEEPLFLCNFNLALGDSLETKQLFAFETEMLHVSNIDSLLLENGEYRKRLQMNVQNGFGEDWVEGIGRMNGLFGPLGGMYFEGEYEDLLCYRENDEILYRKIHESVDYSSLFDGQQTLTFANIGSEWYYDEQFAFSGNIDYIKFTSEGYAWMGEKLCKKITKRHKLECNDRPEIEYVYSSNDTVFFYDPHIEKFQILYAFDAEKSDSWNILVDNENDQTDTIVVTVDSVSTIQINNKNLKQLFVTYKQSNGNYVTAKSTIIEAIGDLQYMFNWYPWYAGACDANFTMGLRCFNNSLIGNYSTGIAESCDFISSSTIYQASNFKIYPNPVEDFITIENWQNIQSIEIYTPNGAQVETIQLVSEQIDLSALPQGNYILRIISHGKIESMEMTKR